MTLKEALKNRIPRVRLPHWANPDSYLRLPLLSGGYVGPWAELYDDCGQSALDIPVGSQRILVVHDSDGRWERYDCAAHPAESENYAKGYVES